MKTTFAKFIAVAAALAATAPALVAQEAAEAEEEAAPATGLAYGQALALARIVNAAAPEESKDAIETVVKDVMASADDANLVAGQITAALAAAIAEKSSPNKADELAQVVAAVAASAEGDAAAALAERSAATIAAVSAMVSFAEKVPEDIASAVADAVADPMSVLTVREATALKELFEEILRTLTPGRYTSGTDNDAIFVAAPPAPEVVRKSPTPVGRR